MRKWVLKYKQWKLARLVRRKEKQVAKGYYLKGHYCLLQGKILLAITNYTCAVKYNPIRKYKKALDFALTLTPRS